MSLYVHIFRIYFCKDIINRHIVFNTLETGVCLWTALFSFSRLAGMCSSMKAVLRSTSTARRSGTVNSILVSRLAIVICTVVLALVSSRSFDRDRSDGCNSLHISDKQSVGRKSFEILFWWTPISESRLRWCILLCLAPIEMRTKYADCPVPAELEVQFVYLSRRFFASVS